LRQIVKKKINKEAKTEQKHEDSRTLGNDVLSLRVDFGDLQKEDCKILGVMLRCWTGICQHSEDHTALIFRVKWSRKKIHAER
jgi:hypothetical protein